MDEADLRVGFLKQFSNKPTHAWFAPGRVNLIGEYTDINGGHVMPAAINSGTYLAARRNDTNCFRIYSDAFSAMAEIDPTRDLDGKATGHWGDFLAGVLVEFRKRGIIGAGLDIHVASDLPLSSGLSSSASLSVGLASLLDDVWSTGLERIDIVRLAKSVENNYVGVNCGIMDQFAIAMGKADHCVLLNCHSMESELVPLKMDGYEVVITDSGVPRKLADSRYNERHRECRDALSMLQNKKPLEHLCGATTNDLDACEELAGRATEYKRARHVVTEDGRVLAAAAALKGGDLKSFGDLMAESHRSLRDDFEVSCPELDALVETASQILGVLGARMTGAGFGGCTVSLVATEAVPNFMKTVADRYDRLTQYQAKFIRCSIGDGARGLSQYG